MSGNNPLDDDEFASKNDKNKKPGAAQRNGDTREPAPLGRSGDTRNK